MGTNRFLGDNNPQKISYNKTPAQMVKADYNTNNIAQKEMALSETFLNTANTLVNDSLELRKSNMDAYNDFVKQDQFNELDGVIADNPALIESEEGLTALEGIIRNMEKESNERLKELPYTTREKEERMRENKLRYDTQINSYKTQSSLRRYQSSIVEAEKAQEYEKNNYTQKFNPITTTQEQQDHLKKAGANIAFEIESSAVGPATAGLKATNILLGGYTDSLKFYDETWGADPTVDKKQYVDNLETFNIFGEDGKVTPDNINRFKEEFDIIVGPTLEGLEVEDQENARVFYDREFNNLISSLEMTEGPAMQTALNNARQTLFKAENTTDAVAGRYTLLNSRDEAINELNTVTPAYTTNGNIGAIAGAAYGGAYSLDPGLMSDQQINFIVDNNNGEKYIGFMTDQHGETYTNLSLIHI